MCNTKSLSLMFATIFALISPLINGAIIEKRSFIPPDNTSSPDVNTPPTLPNAVTAAAPGVAATPGTAAIPATPASLAASLAAPVTSPASLQITDPAPPGPAGCSWATCNLFYQYVNVYYWPEETQNTACLSAYPNITSTSSQIPNIQSPSVYVVFPSIRGWDGCSQIGTHIVDLTTSFAPGALSTIGLDNTTRSFNFGDLPCPPADVGWDSSKGPYAPRLAPPEFLFNLDPAFKTCIPGATQGIDPYTTLTTVAADSGPGVVGCRRGQCKGAKRALEHAYPMPWAPQRTAEPTL